MPEWNGMEDFKNGMEDNLLDYKNAIYKNATVEKEFLHLRFNRECKRNNILPKSLRFRPPTKSRKGFKLARKMGWKFLQLRISDSHRKINKRKREIFELENNLENLLTSTEWNNLCLYARQKSRLIQTNSEKVQRDKLNCLLSSLPAMESDSVQKKWVKNLLQKKSLFWK